MSLSHLYSLFIQAPLPPLFSFRLPSDGPQAPGNIYLSWLLLPHILMDVDCQTLGSAGSLLASVLRSPYICISIKSDASSL